MAATLPARLAPAMTREVFRTVLDALARPGRIFSLPSGLDPSLPPAIVPVLALADLEVTVAVIGDDAGWTATIATATGAVTTTVERAGWVVALRPPTAGDVAELQSGTALAPERGARFFVACDDITGADETAGREPEARGSTVLTIAGPGVPGQREIAVRGVPADVFTALARRNEQYPAGIDTWLCSADGRVVALPRSLRTAISQSDGAG